MSSDGQMKWHYYSTVYGKWDLFIGRHPFDHKEHNSDLDVIVIDQNEIVIVWPYGMVGHYRMKVEDEQ